MSIKYINEILEKGLREHPELGVGLKSEGLDTKSVGNTQVRDSLSDVWFITF